MKLLDKYLSLEKDFVIDCLNKSYSIEDFWNALNIGAGLRSNRDRPTFEKHFDIHIIEQLELNQQQKKQKEIAELFNQDRVCKHPNCNKHFTWNDHPYSDFCSSYCAHSYSGKHANPENISDGMHTSEKVKQANLKHRKLYKCKVCQKLFYFCDSTAHSRSFCSEECKKQFWKDFYARPEIGGKRHGSGRGKKGWYKGYYCDSSWELAWVIYQLDHNVKFERYTKWFLYKFNGEQRKYFPDFLMEDGSFVEIKGYDSLEWQAKLKSFPKELKIKVYYKDDMKTIFDYVVATYGKDWIHLYDDSKHTSL